MSHSSNTGRVLRVGVFFDGTANNQYNSELGQARRAQGLTVDPTSSYASVPTNIALLYRHYPVQSAFEADGIRMTSLYISGIGTTTGKADTRFPAQTYGRGSTGVVGKAKEAHARLLQCLMEAVEVLPPRALQRVQLDLFGFSRGAAAARHFANEVNATRFDTLFELAPGFTCEINFIGLFDTVAAMGGLVDVGNISDDVNPGLNLYLGPDSARHVVQLSARDEVRRNFALSRIAPQWPMDVAVPGVHADVGGGYPLEMLEDVLLTRWKTNLVSPGTSPMLTQAWKATAAELPLWQARDLLDDTDPQALLEIRTASHQLGTRKDPLQRVQAAIYMRRRVYGHLSRVYLRVMHTLAREQGVPFKALSDTSDTRLPEALLPIADKLLMHVMTGRIALSHEDERLLRQRYIHQSANWNAAIGDGIGAVDQAFFNLPQDGGRLVYDQHDPLLA
ncbi:hypothetical protein CJF39_10520 [Pseudomonas lundensis]|uniref:T6SS Phospholipase effector Tle1-like catalytic domain-containing protein n=1 Tax=Pseudomonas lundensis TaxID=86185 RepID=A0A266NAJ5_9PSED|nr:DUF2235 domain-containing protein [Pseudomonas lundensis]OZY59538.1 hypothetical protein CJF39_10520 [Pseudomonas lundensis]